MFTHKQNHPMRRITLLCLLATGLTFSNASLAQKGERKGPPQEALTACEGLARNAQCTFTGRDGEMSGVCLTPSDDKPLACRPEGDNRRGQRFEENGSG